MPKSPDVHKLLIHESGPLTALSAVVVSAAVGAILWAGEVVFESIVGAVEAVNPVVGTIGAVAFLGAGVAVKEKVNEKRESVSHLPFSQRGIWK